MTTTKRTPGPWEIQGDPSNPRQWAERTDLNHRMHVARPMNRHGHIATNAVFHVFVDDIQVTERGFKDITAAMEKGDKIWPVGHDRVVVTVPNNVNPHAAPELLKALIDIVEYEEMDIGQSHVSKIARAAIEKGQKK